MTPIQEGAIGILYHADTEEDNDVTILIGRDAESGA